MTFFKKHRHLTSLLCSVLVVAMMLPGISSAAAEVTELGQPQKMKIGQKIEQTVFYNEKGNKVNLKFSEGEYTMLTFWASWCPDCKKEFEFLPKLTPVLKEYDNVNWYMVDLVDGKYETIQTGDKFMKKMKTTLPALYDKGRVLTDELKVHQIPTTIILDDQGRVVLSDCAVIKSKAHLRSMLDYATKGRDKAPLNYLQKELLKEEKMPAELRGYLAEYAAMSLNGNLLKEQGKWLSDNHMTTKNMGSDLAMYSALTAWKGYEGQASQLRDQIEDTYFNKNELTGKMDIGDIDLQAIHTLGDEKYKNALSAVKGAYISDKFPMYYTSYDADKDRYSKKTIDTEESLLAVYHLAEEGKVEKSTLKWLNREIKNKGLGSAYNVEGRKVKGAKGEQPGLYALSAMIGLETGDKQLFTNSMLRLEALRSFEAGKVNDGRFKAESNKVFNQVMPLMLYAEIEAKGL